MLHDQEAVVVLLQDDYEFDGCEKFLRFHVGLDNLCPNSNFLEPVWPEHELSLRCRGIVCQFAIS